MLSSSPLGVVSTTDLGWRTIRLRWEKILPTEFSTVRFFNPEDFERSPKAWGSRSLRQMLNTRKAAKAAIASGFKNILVTTNTDAALLPLKTSAHYSIYMDATHGQAQWITFRSPVKPRLKMRIERVRKLAKEGHAFVCMSRFAAHGAAEEYKALMNQIWIVPPPVDLVRYRPEMTHPTPPLRALFIGTRFDAKGGDVILDLCSDPDLLSVEWHMVTPAKRAAPSNVNFYHNLRADTDELISRIRSCDVLVLPTRSDMLSLAALECMACGLAVIIRNLGATSEVVDDGATGYVIDRADPSAVKEALMRYIRSPELLRTHGMAGRAKTEREYTYALHAKRLRAAVESDR
jgi:glycosyltransferase involved in cell wall biosynthesis